MADLSTFEQYYKLADRLVKAMDGIKGRPCWEYSARVR
jgi:hypothetical protein